MSDTSGSRGMRAAAVGVLLAWVGALLAAVVTAGVGVAGLAGWSSSFVQRVDVSGGLGLVVLDVAPTWEAGGVREICAEVDIVDYPTECLGFVLSDHAGGAGSVDGVARQGDVVPQSHRAQRTPRPRRGAGLERAARLAVPHAGARAAGRRR